MAQNPSPPGIEDNPIWQLKQTHKATTPVVASAPSQRTIAPAASTETQALNLNDDQLERRGVYRLVGNDPNLPFNDLEPLKDIIGDATVVGLGHEYPSAGGSYSW